MPKKGTALCLVAFLVCIGIAGCAKEGSSNRVVSEKLTAQVDLSSRMPKTFRVSPDSKQVAYVAKVADKCLVVVNGKEGKQYDAIGTLIFSPDSQRVAYVAGVGDKRLVVVDGKEEKQYDDIMKGTPIFSPDSKRLVYVAQVRNKRRVVMDGREERKYNSIAIGSLIFSPDSKRIAYQLKWEMSGLWSWMEKRERNMIVSLLLGEEGSLLIRQIVSITLPEKILASIWWRRG